ncbi:MAG TPA: GNAT family N-acetyltransferase [Chloroflexota bacterium]|jgi:hypothetical protein|nr:GNAT family N-acetyltransferase [Chloroflexota bacterium]
MAVTSADVERIERHYLALWSSLGRLLDGSPMEATPFDSGLAMFWPEVPAPLFNRVIGIGRSGPVDGAALDRLIERYRSYELPFQIQLLPSSRDPRIRKFLAECGLTLQPASPILALKPDLWQRVTQPPGVTVEELANLDDGSFSWVLLESFEMPIEVKDWVMKLAAFDGVTNFLGRVEGRPAGTGMLVEESGVAGLYSGGVLEQFRRRGLHRALIAKRVETAFSRGHDLLMSETEAEGNQSFRDLARQGFEIAYRHENWGERASGT